MDRDGELMNAIETAEIYGERLLAVEKLHRKVTRYTISATEEYTSYGSLEAARESWEELVEPYPGDPAPEFEHDEFYLCAECSENVRREMDANGIEEWAYSEQWPCKTAQALGMS